jgi:hypothetical protein
MKGCMGKIFNQKQINITHLLYCWYFPKDGLFNITECSISFISITGKFDGAHEAKYI